MQMTPGAVLHEIGQLRQVSGWRSGWHMSSARQISPEVSLSCHLHVVHRSSACCPHEISTGNIFPLKEQTVLLKSKEQQDGIFWAKKTKGNGLQQKVILYCKLFICYRRQELDNSKQEQLQKYTQGYLLWSCLIWTFIVLMRTFRMQTSFSSGQLFQFPPKNSHSLWQNLCISVGDIMDVFFQNCIILGSSLSECMQNMSILL